MVSLSVALMGCAHRYDMLLTNGVSIANVSRPVLNRDAGVYVYKDSLGQMREIPAGRVVEIAPHGKNRAENFNGSPEQGSNRAR